MTPTRFGAYKVELSLTLEGRAMIKPRNPLFLRATPNEYYEDYRLAGAIQGIEAALLSLCFGQYSQALVSLVGATEKAMKAYADISESKKINFHPLRDRFVEKLGRYPEALKEETVWPVRDLRNKIEHSGNSPSYDLVAAESFILNGWNAYSSILEEAYKFKIVDALPSELAKSISWAQSILQANATYPTKIERPYFLRALVSGIRHLARPTFFSVTSDFLQESGREDDLQFTAKMEWRATLQRQYEWVEMDSIDCPVCGDMEAVWGTTATELDTLITIHFEFFVCPDCSLSISDHCKEPFHAQTILTALVTPKLHSIGIDYNPDLTNVAIDWSSSRN